MRPHRPYFVLGWCQDSVVSTRQTKNLNVENKAPPPPRLLRKHHYPAIIHDVHQGQNTFSSGLLIYCTEKEAEALSTEVSKTEPPQCCVKENVAGRQHVKSMSVYAVHNEDIQFVPLTSPIPLLYVHIHHCHVPTRTVQDAIRWLPGTVTRAHRNTRVLYNM